MNELKKLIKEGRKEQILNVLNEKLILFENELSAIERKIKQCPKQQSVEHSLLRLSYNQKWVSTVNMLPIPKIDKHSSVSNPQENLRLTSLISKGELPVTSYNEQLTISIIQYINYIYNKEGLPYLEIICWSVLSVLADVYDLTVVTIPIKSVLQEVKMFAGMQVSNKQKPTNCYFNGTMYYHLLSSSEKGAIKRLSKLQKLVGYFITNYKKEHNGKPPNRAEVREFLLNNTPPDFQSVYHSYNYRTMTKILQGYTNLLDKGRHRRK